ncbi:hypothetical protein [Rufibacter hautae]|uniref:Universal stress protein n=1 Tax=Rufibacter hautae TaxID=2595005 RepID=A0A5B6TGJ1_9BACT|nr:hypothetical protein [Rufibacter hautae]KAA3439501.1 hypothetical protein FOA19_02095 [Rufibacter hautae]
MIHVLIPSNFKADSLHCLPELSEIFPGLPLKVIFFHAFGLSSSITELLMLSRRTKEEELVSSRFTSLCRQAQQEGDWVQAIEHTWFYGTTMAAFKNFLNANEISFIAVPANFRHQALGKLSQNPMLFLEKCGLPVIAVAPRVPKAVQVLEKAG